MFPCNKREKDGGAEITSRKQDRDQMFKPQDKLFLNDMSNILQVEEQTT